MEINTNVFQDTKIIIDPYDSIIVRQHIIINVQDIIILSVFKLVFQQTITGLIHDLFKTNNTIKIKSYYYCKTNFQNITNRNPPISQNIVNCYSRRLQYTNIEP